MRVSRYRQVGSLAVRNEFSQFYTYLASADVYWIEAIFFPRIDGTWSFLVDFDGIYYLWRLCQISSLNLLSKTSSTSNVRVF